MGAKILPYIVAGSLGYYMGTIKSGQYSDIFESQCMATYLLNENIYASNSEYYNELERIIRRGD